MTTPEQPLPAGGPRREALALEEIEHTDATRAVVWLLLVSFLAAIVAVPLLDRRVVRELWSELVTNMSAHTGDSIFSLNHAALTELAAFERGLEDESLIGRSLRVPAQTMLTGTLGAGNERVYPGRDGWLFYRDDVAYIVGRGFLEPAEMKRRADEVPAWETPPVADPRPAIVRFKKDLEARGITLIVMPTPVKPGVHPEKLARRAEGLHDRVLHNASYATLLADLQREGVIVFDGSEHLQGTGAQYLATDTHWRPETGETLASALAASIDAHTDLPAVPDPQYRIQRVEQTNIGDVARMLDLAEGGPLFPAETVWLRRVLNEDGSTWRSSPEAEVLVLGDSFSNMYSLESMGWGTSAGFVEQLSYALRRPVDRLTQNDQGSFATREMLARDPSRLAGKRIVVYQFAARELASGNWKIVPLP